jgi:hypothetical protein
MDIGCFKYPIAALPAVLLNNKVEMATINVIKEELDHPLGGLMT